MEPLGFSKFTNSEKSHVLLIHIIIFIIRTTEQGETQTYRHNWKLKNSFRISVPVFLPMDGSRSRSLVVTWSGETCGNLCTYSIQTVIWSLWFGFFLQYVATLQAIFLSLLHVMCHENVKCMYLSLSCEIEALRMLMRITWQMTFILSFLGFLVILKNSK